MLLLRVVQRLAHKLDALLQGIDNLGYLLDVALTKLLLARFEHLLGCRAHLLLDERELIFDLLLVHLAQRGELLVEGLFESLLLALRSLLCRRALLLDASLQSLGRGTLHVALRREALYLVALLLDTLLAQGEVVARLGELLLQLFDAY